MGLEPTTNEARIGTASGVVRARTIKRRPEDERWNIDAIKSVVGMPWQPILDVKSGVITAEAIVPAAESRTEVVYMPQEEPMARRRLKLMKEDIIRAGFTVGCVGCRAIQM